MKNKQNKRNTKKFRKNLEKRKSTTTNQGFNWSKVPTPLIRLIFGEKEVGLNRNHKVRFVTNYNTLPNQGMELVQEYLQTNKVFTSGCHTNSMMLSCKSPIINTIHGFVGVKMNTDEIFLWKKHLGIQTVSGLVKSEVQGYGTYFFDFRRKMKYFRHSWNEMDGIHFDLTKSLNSEVTDWWNYYPTEKINLSNSKLKNFKNITKVVKMFKHQLESEGERILNIHQLKMVS